MDQGLEGAEDGCVSGDSPVRPRTTATCAQASCGACVHVARGHGLSDCCACVYAATAWLLPWCSVLSLRA